jgi:RimJ/RimL family protein N-acetyltransferase
MGPPDKQPDFPILDTYDLPGYRQVARAPTIWECNWLQVKENSMDPAHLQFLHTLPGSEGFTEDFKEHPEWDWMETPVGMVYIDTRRQGDRVWVRVADFILPNIHQFPPNADPMALRNSVNRPMATTWAVPLDDTHTMQIGYYRAPEGREFRRGAGFGQDASRSYEERQRIPGDYDAQVSIHGGIARHGLEHLASTDRGIIMMRNMIRRGIRAVKSGGNLDYRILHNGGAIPTYSHDRVVSGIPPAGSPDADKQLLRDTARKVVSGTIAAGSAEA